MSNHLGQPARHQRVVTSKAVVITATAVATASLVAVAYTFAAPPQGSAKAASFVTASSSSGPVRLTAAGLDSLLNARFAPLHSAVTDQGSSAAQQVAALLGTGSGQLSEDGNTLTLTVPAIGNMNGSVVTALTPIGAQMGDLSGANGEVANSVNSSVVGISPLLNLTGPHATVSANVPFDLDAAVAPELSGTTNQGVVSISPQAGTVAIDLSKLLASSGDGTQTLSPAAIAEIQSDINAASANLGDNLVNAATNSVESTPVNVNANVNLVSAPTSTGSSTCDTSGTTSGTTSTTGGLLGDTLNNLLGGTLGGTVSNTVSGLVCSLPTNLLPGLLTSLGLNLNGNVGQIIEGTAPPATGSVTVLGAPKPFNGSTVTGNVANALVTNFGGSTGTSGSDGSGTGSGSTNSGGSGIGLTINGNLGDGGLGGLGLGGLGLGGSGTSGLGLGGLNLGGILGSNGTTGITPGILQSLLNNGGSNNLPGISASVGNGSTTGSATTGSSSGSCLLCINGSVNGLNGSVKVSKPAPATGSGGSTTGSTGSGSTSSGSGLLGLLHIGTPTTGGTTTGNGILNLGF
jgi:hypothetical protein